MSKNQHKKHKLESEAKKQDALEREAAPGEVLMRFKENKYYNDLNSPMFEAGKVYPLKGEDWIQRWKKRGGEIVNPDEVKEEDLSEVGSAVEKPKAGDEDFVPPPITPAQPEVTPVSEDDAKREEFANKQGDQE